MSHDTREALGESKEWEAAYIQTRRSLWRRKNYLNFFDWPEDRAARILDLGAGDGLDREILAQRGYTNVTCVDISFDLVAKSQGPRMVADAHRLPMADGSVDVVLANSVLHHLELDRLLPEIARVLAHGGRFIYLEPRPSLIRSVLDWFTYSFPPSQLLAQFRARKISMIEETEIWKEWVKILPTIPPALERLGFVLDKDRRAAVGILAQWRRVKDA